MLVRITQQDVVYRRYLHPENRSYVPDFGVYIKVQGSNGEVEYRTLSRQLVLFCVERRKSWRMLQSKSGIENKEYKAQRSILADVDAGKISHGDLFARAEELMKERMPSAPEQAPRPPAPAPAVMAKVQAKAWEVVSKSVAIHPSKPAAVASKPIPVAAKKESENDEVDWEERVQVRLMELDVDPGHDADQGVITKSGD
jgi:hypothetical protein